MSTGLRWTHLRPHPAQLSQHPSSRSALHAAAPFSSGNRRRGRPRSRPAIAGQRQHRCQRPVNHACFCADPRWSVLQLLHTDPGCREFPVQELRAGRFSIGTPLLPLEPLAELLPQLLDERRPEDRIEAPGRWGPTHTFERRTLHVRRRAVLAHLRWRCRLKPRYDWGGNAGMPCK